MIRIAITGGIGSGKTFMSKLFGYPVFNADKAVSNIYLKNKKIFFRIKKKLPKLSFSFPIKKRELINAILENKGNLKKISSIVHPEVRKSLISFLQKNKNKRIVVLDIPLFLENKLNRKTDIIIFIQANKKQVLKKIKKRKNFNVLILKRLEDLQLDLSYKKKKSHYVIKNNFNKKTARKKVKDILKIILQ